MFAPPKVRVSVPEEVIVTVVGDGHLIEVESDDEDRGRTMGRQGRVARAIRAVLGASRDGAD